MRRSIGVVAALLVAALSVSFGPRATAVDRAVTVSPNDQLIDGQWIDVGWTGFEPDGEVRARLCPASATGVDDCAKDTDSLAEPGDSRLETSGGQGQGSTPFVVKAKEVQRTNGGDPFRCDAENPCRLYVFELGPGGAEDSFAASAFAPLSYAVSTIDCPVNEPRVAGSGATAARAGVVQWQAETCRPPLSLNVSYATSNSVNGKAAFVQGLSDADFAMSALGLNDTEREALTKRPVTPLHVPVALGSLVLVYNLWFDLDNDGNLEQVKDLRLSPATAARIITGRLGSWDEDAVTNDNNGRKFPPKSIVPVGRADNSAATWWLSSWLHTTAKDAWEAGGDSFQNGPTTIFPAGNGVQLRTGTDAVAAQVREGGSRGIPETGPIGFVYYSEALKLGLPVVALQNAAGEYVKPTAESILAAVSAGSVAADGVFTPNFATTDPKAYPMPVVSYAIVPAGGAGGLDAPRAQVLYKFLQYAVGDGQKNAELRGYVPLPDALVTKSSASIPRIVPAEVKTPTASTNSPGTTGTDPPSVGSAPAVGLTPAEAVLNTAVPGLGTAVRSVFGSPSSTSDSATPASSITNALPAPVKSAVSGIVRLLNGGRSPMTVQELLLLGGIAVIVGRAMAVLAARQRQRSGVRPVRPVGARP